MGALIWLGDKLRPVLAPVALRAEPLPPLAQVGLALAAGLALALVGRPAPRVPSSR
jgi:hypothetical protein